jgi:DNA-directed RNA polymerase specialized sigma24 family protein
MASTVPLLGDEAELFALYHVTLRARVARWVNTSSANLDDACAIAWLQLLRCQPKRETILSWLTTVAIREAVRIDRAARRTSYVDTDDLSNESVADPELQRDALDALDALAGLPERQRQLAALQASGFTYDEIAWLSRDAGVVGALVAGRVRRRHVVSVAWWH